MKMFLTHSGTLLSWTMGVSGLDSKRGSGCVSIISDESTSQPFC